MKSVGAKPYFVADLLGRFLAVELVERLGALSSSSLAHTSSLKLAKSKFSSLSDWLMLMSILFRLMSSFMYSCNCLHPFLIISKGGYSTGLLFMFNAVRFRKVDISNGKILILLFSSKRYLRNSCFSRPLVGKSVRRLLRSLKHRKGKISLMQRVKQLLVYKQVGKKSCG